MKQTILAISILLTTMPAIASDGFFGEVLLGDSHQEYSSTLDSESLISLDDDANTYGFTGGYRFFQHFAVELGYQEYGSFSALINENINFDINSSSINLGVKAILPVSQDFSVNARLGFTKWDSDIKASIDNTDILNTNDDGNDIYYAVGAEYKINESLFVGLRYSMLTMNWKDRLEEEGGTVSIDYEHEIKNISLSVGMSF